MHVDITPEQCRAARQLINWTAIDLANASGVSAHAISNFERAQSVFRQDRMQAIVEAFEGAGIEFLPEARGKGEGVRLREPRQND